VRLGHYRRRTVNQRFAQPPADKPGFENAANQIDREE
jgi:hypothetical protein